MNNIEKKALTILKQNKVAIFIVAYNAESHIESTIKRIPKWVVNELEEIFIIDDKSTDKTIEALNSIKHSFKKPPLNIFCTPNNQGYGGNQKIGYTYAISKKFDIVILLHGDGQYSPESIPKILAQYAKGYDAVYGSRFMPKLSALKGGMPFYKWIGNIILTSVQNKLLGSKMSEMHSGFRSYRISSLSKIPFHLNMDNFTFDADIIAQLHIAKFQIKEVSIPTHYGDEICYVNGLSYAWGCIKTFVKYRVMQYEIFYDPKFDIRIRELHPYTAKLAKTSLHYYMSNFDFGNNKKILDVGGGDGTSVAQSLSKKYDVTCIDQYIGRSSSTLHQIKLDLNNSWQKQEELHNFDVVLALDVIEHMCSPETCIKEIFDTMKVGGKLYASTGNVGFLIIRIMLLFGFFNYGRRGILDLTHTRLMTVNSFKRLLSYGGFKVEQVVGFGPPLEVLKNNNLLLKIINTTLSFFAHKYPSLFAFHFLIICTKKDGFNDIVNTTTGVLSVDK
ncbi:glycosyltransferase [Candidatus Woesearchaeota archaeon]|jgi:glycosyltransferase involved in cell wall biosynthesis|nr:glycosyltransferase [Candidatus Woesearchaeota archaeon]